MGITAGGPGDTHALANQREGAAAEGIYSCVTFKVAYAAASGEISQRVVRFYIGGK